MPTKIFDSYPLSIKQVFQDKMFYVPVYQRPYSWEAKHVKVLLDDIFYTYNLPAPKREEGYFIGSIYIHDLHKKLNAQHSKYDIIDGQQRITTITFLLLSIFCVACEKRIPKDNPKYMAIKESLWKFTNQFDEDNRVLELNSIEKKCFTDLFNKCFRYEKELLKEKDTQNVQDILGFIDSYESKSIFDSRIIENFKIIYLRVREYFLSEPYEKLIDFVTFILEHIQVIAIIYDNAVNKAFTIFESINSKGKSLEEIDKIKGSVRKYCCFLI